MVPRKKLISGGFALITNRLPSLEIHVNSCQYSSAVIELPQKTLDVMGAPWEGVDPPSGKKSVEGARGGRFHT